MHLFPCLMPPQYQKMLDAEDGDVPLNLCVTHKRYVWSARMSLLLGGTGSWPLNGRAIQKIRFFIVGANSVGKARGKLAQDKGYKLIDS
jgi:hypothetical protein